MYEKLNHKINNAKFTNSKSYLKSSLFEFFSYIKTSLQNQNCSATYRIDPAFANDKSEIFPSEIGLGLLAETTILVFQWKPEVAKKFSEDIQDIALEVLTAHKLEQNRAQQHNILEIIEKLKQQIS